MEEKELIKIITAALEKAKVLKSHCNYQGDKALQILTRDGTVFNIMPVAVTESACHLCSKR
ncbi:MAG: hypothetical protein EOM87_09410 [Clostridia bacterium]|nr:hypothetical protein [Clostridia bacterium]